MMILRLNSDGATPTECLDYFLPPANEVWGKVLISKVFVCPQGGRGSVSRERRSAYRGGLHLEGEGLHKGGVCIQGDGWPASR